MYRVLFGDRQERAYNGDCGQSVEDGLFDHGISDLTSTGGVSSRPAPRGCVTPIPA